jgi:CBS domain-containing protein
MPVGDYCRRGLWVARPDQTVREAACLMDRHRVGCVVVVSGTDPVGILTDRDVALEVIRRKLDPDAVRVEDLMHAPLVVVREDASVRSALDRMRGDGLRRLPVVDAEGQLVGIVTADDLAVILAAELAQLGRAIESQRVDPPPDLEEKRSEQAIEWSE